MLGSSLIIVSLLVVLVVVLVRLARVLNERDSALQYAAYVESLVDQWAAYATTLERDNAASYDSLFAYSAKHANGNKGQLPLVFDNGKANVEHVTDIDGKPTLLVASLREFTTRGGKVISVPAPVKAESKSGDNNQNNGKGKHGKDNGKGGKSGDTGKAQALPTNESTSGDMVAITDAIRAIVGDLSPRELAKIADWQGGKGKSDAPEYAKRIQGMRKGGK